MWFEHLESIIQSFLLLMDLLLVMTRVVSCFSSSAHDVAASTPIAWLISYTAKGAWKSYSSSLPLLLKVTTLPSTRDYLQSRAKSPSLPHLQHRSSWWQYLLSSRDGPCPCCPHCHLGCFFRMILKQHCTFSHPYLGLKVLYFLWREPFLPLLSRT